MIRPILYNFILTIQSGLSRLYIENSKYLPGLIIYNQELYIMSAPERSAALLVKNTTTQLCIYVWGLAKIFWPFINGYISGYILYGQWPDRVWSMARP
jgi:hypothetical protein